MELNLPLNYIFDVVDIAISCSMFKFSIFFCISSTSLVNWILAISANMPAKIFGELGVSRYVWKSRQAVLGARITKKLQIWAGVCVCGLR